MKKFKHTSVEYESLFNRVYRDFDIRLEWTDWLGTKSANKSVWNFFIYLLAVEDSQEKITLETFRGSDEYNYIDFNLYKLFYPTIGEKTLQKEYDTYVALFCNIANCPFFIYESTNIKTSTRMVVERQIIPEILHTGNRDYLKINPNILTGGRENDIIPGR